MYCLLVERSLYARPHLVSCQTPSGVNRGLAISCQTPLGYIVAMAKKRLPAAVRAYFKKKGAEGGKIGGPKRMQSLSPEERSALAKAAAEKRWGKKSK